MLFTIKLKENKDFLKIYKKGKYIISKACVFYYMPNKLPFNRIGITTGKKVGNAVSRNRARRVIISAYRQNEVKFPLGYDIVIVAKDNAAKVKSTVIADFYIKKVIPLINNDFKNPTTKNG